ncbi:hypothetical protein BHS05_30575 [Myxococcus xanthus]|uniref:Transposase n=1 Tax=Myxococcus xanthus TaxID=34 RepID=A0AAE6G4W8_MYXXA|nr:hypothetical protein BHS09_30785 [Myxococcus xanthus]QDE78293.1 hypothetical protein BHS08_30805 [Myxococcus xanthus]QDE99832.1 hypothetical protein BHS05_30575 [Myxococcus xanthus]QDF07574.1 hypothetical protein BHS04_30885 [Myxococcus xanthus]
MVRILREAEAPGASVVEVARKHGVAEQTLYRWRQKFGGMEASDATRLKELEKENARLKKSSLLLLLGGEMARLPCHEKSCSRTQQPRP